MGMFTHWKEEDSFYCGLTSSVSEYGSSDSCRRWGGLDEYPRYKEEYNPPKKETVNEKISKDEIESLMDSQINDCLLEPIPPIPWKPTAMESASCGPYEPIGPKPSKDKL